MIKFTKHFLYIRPINTYLYATWKTIYMNDSISPLIDQYISERWKYQVHAQQIEATLKMTHNNPLFGIFKLESVVVPLVGDGR
jgi:hypothetical protein